MYTHTHTYTPQVRFSGGSPALSWTRYEGDFVRRLWRKHCLQKEGSGSLKEWG